MKNLLVLIPVIISFLAAAQPAKSTFGIGGSASFSNQSEKSPIQAFNPATNQFEVYTTTSKIQALTFSPNVSYFVTRRLAVGLDLSIQRGKTDADQGPSFSFTVRKRSLGIGPFVRYYQPLTNKFYAIVEGGDMMLWTKETFTGIDYTDSYAGTREDSRKLVWFASVGAAYFFAPNMGVEILGKFNKDTGDKFPERKSFTLNVGFQILLNRKSE